MKTVEIELNKETQFIFIDRDRVVSMVATPNEFIATGHKDTDYTSNTNNTTGTLYFDRIQLPIKFKK